MVWLWSLVFPVSEILTCKPQEFNLKTTTKTRNNHILFDLCACFHVCNFVSFNSVGSGLVVCMTWMPIVKWGSLSWEVMIVYSFSGSKEDSGEGLWWIWGYVVTMTSNDTPQCRIELKVLWEWGCEKPELTKLVIMNHEIFVQIVDINFLQSALYCLNCLKMVLLFSCRAVLVWKCFCCSPVELHLKMLETNTLLDVNWIPLYSW
jgi:hypothetical protein